MRKNAVFALLLSLCLLCGCVSQVTQAEAPKSDESPQEPEQEPDLFEQFRSEEVFDSSFYKKDIYISENTICRAETGSAHRSVVMPLEFGSAYVFKPFEDCDKMSAVLVDFDPEDVKIGENRLLGNGGRVLEFGGNSNDDNLTVIPDKEGQYILLYLSALGEEYPLEIKRSTILLEEDTEGDWWYPPEIGAVDGSEGSWANWDWNSEQLYANIYDPLMAQYPDYISYKIIGVDQTEQYSIRAYTFEPKDFEQVIIINTGMHGNEIDAYLAVAKFLQLLANEDGSHAGLHYLRTKVKLVVIPIVNVWSSHNKHIYRNSANVNINRDYLNVTQNETRAVLEVLNEYKGKASAILDFHCYNMRDTIADLYYKCNLTAPNAPAVFKTVNHIYQRLCERDLAREPIFTNYPTDTLIGNHLLLGCAWNTYNIPSMTVEHSMDHYFENHSVESVSLALENFGNIIIQHALLKIRIIEK